MENSILLESGAAMVGVNLVNEALKAMGLPSRFVPMTTLVLAGGVGWLIGRVHGLGVEMMVYNAIAIAGAATYGYEAAKQFRQSYEARDK